MTNQLQGETLFGGWTGTAAADWAYTPWIPVRGDFAKFAVQALAINGITLTWEVQTRTLEDPTATTVAGTGGSLTITTISVGSSLNATACKQLVRYRFKTGSASTTNYVCMRALQPSWQVDR